MVRCPRGLRSTPGKRVYGNVSRVRIPFSPPENIKIYASNKDDSKAIVIISLKLDSLSLDESFSFFVI